MKLVVGLGNPGPQYAETRHNVGFQLVDGLARRWGCEVTRHEKRFEGLMGEAAVAGDRVLLLKPLTFMNVSGRSVGALMRFYKLEQASLLVAYDDLDLPVGQLRLRASGSAGGQKGMADVLRTVGSPDVSRIRIGIGRGSAPDAVGHVLGRFSPQERALLGPVLDTAVDAADCWAREGIEAAMNRFNRRSDGPAAN